MTTFTKPLLAGLLTTAAILTGTGARAQETPSADRRAVSGSIAAGIATVPDYEGAKQQKPIPLIAGDVHWGERYFAIQGTSARINILNSKIVEFGPAANLTFGRDAKAKPLSVRALGKIDDAYEVGAFAAVKTGSVLRDGDELKLRVQGSRDVSDVHEGWSYEAAASYRLPLAPRLLLIPELALHLADDKYAATYFSVTPAGSASSGLRTYAAKGGVKDVGASLTAVYAFSDKWSLIGFGGYRRLVGDFKNSPIVRDTGRANQFSGGVGIGFRF